jgi:hypothetical protein
MPDLLIRDVPDDIVAVIDAKAKRLGLSRTEFVRRQLTQAAARSDEPVSAEDLSAFSTSFADLGNPDVMARAWR